MLSAKTEQFDVLAQESWLASPGSADEVGVAVVTGNDERDQLWPPSVVTRASPGGAFDVGLALPCSGPAIDDAVEGARARERRDIDVAGEIVHGPVGASVGGRRELVGVAGAQVTAPGDQAAGRWPRRN